MTNIKFRKPTLPSRAGQVFAAETARRRAPSPRSVYNKGRVSDREEMSMTIQELLPLIEGELLTAQDAPGKEISCGYACDLLSWVMARGQSGMAWVTVQLHLNVIAVAALHEMSCVILPEGLRMEEAALQKAREEGIAVLSTPLSAYAVCAAMAGAGIPA